MWLEAVRKCSAAVVGLDMALGLSMVRRSSLKRSLKRRLVSPMYCKLNHVNNQQLVNPADQINN